MGHAPSARRVRVERGIYRQPNGKYAVCTRHAGRLRFRTVGDDPVSARRARLELIVAVRAGTEPISPRLRFDTVAGWWLERFEVKVASGERHPRRSRRTATTSTATSYRTSGVGGSPRSQSMM